MQIYLLASNLLILTALGLSLWRFSRGERPRRLLPLFLLAISRLLALILFLSLSDVSVGVGALDIFGVFCLVWILTGPLSTSWPWLARLESAGAVLLSLTPLILGDFIPFALYSLTIAIFSLPFILVSHRPLRWSYLFPPLLLAGSNFLSLLEFGDLAWLVSLPAYAFLIIVVQNGVELSQAEKRWLAVGQLICDDSPRPMDHIVRRMAHITRVDQSALVVLENERARLLSRYNAAASFPLENQSFTLAHNSLLQKAIQTQRPLLLAHYALGREEPPGPALIQPLTVQGQPMGALILGNPLSHRPIGEETRRLCQTLAPQIALIVGQNRPLVQVTTAQEEVEKDEEEEPVAYLTILEAIDEGVVVSDRSGQVRFVNQAAERILSQPASQLIGQPIGAVYGEIDSGEPIEDLIVDFSRRDKPLPTFIETNDRIIQGQLVPWRNGDNEWLGIIAIFRDITQELRADRTRRDFVSLLSRLLHDPITLIRGYSNLIAGGGTEHQQRQIQHIIHSSAERVVELLENAVQISANNRAKRPPRFESINVNELIEVVLQEITPLAELRSLRLKRDIRDELPPIMADYSYLYRILENLLSNACRFTPPGGRVMLRAWIQQEREGNRVRPYLLMAVADNGVGIPKKELKRVFDLFYQADNQNPVQERGMGIGLAVVKELVELHQGRVWVESVSGEGSIFHVALPVDPSV